MFLARSHFNFKRSFLLLVVILLTALHGTTVASAQTPPAPGLYNNTIFGPNVYVMSPSVSTAAIASQLNALNHEAQFSTNRYAVMFQPGSYGTTSNPLTAPVGFYEQISGLGANPDGVSITGGFGVDQLIGGNMTQNFWRSQENMQVIPTGQPTKGVLDWGVSQGASLRRMDIYGGLWYANSQPIGSLNACQEASGGFMADSVVLSQVNACSQQQWYTRNSNLVGGFQGNVWNFVFSGVLPGNTPAQSYPNGATGDTNVTNLATTPISREKPFIYMDGNGYHVFVPSSQTNSSGPTWSGGALGNGYNGNGFQAPISAFYIATPSSSLTDINNALASSLSLILTPGIYKYNGPIVVTKPGTVVLGMGYATIVPQTGSPAMIVADVDNVQIAGILFDAGPVNSPVLLEIGQPGLVNNNHTTSPTSLNDVYFRIGGATAGSADTALQVDSGDVIMDNIWAWRADHGNAGTYGWTVNTAKHGVIVNGSNVTALGLAVEHFQQEQVLWNGDKGKTIFYQSELPYDPPSQAAWTNGLQNGYPSYVVSPSSVCTHTAYGLGIYSYFDLGVNIIDDNAMTVPNATGINITDVGTVFLNGAGQISNIINGTGGAANAASSGKLNPLAAYDAFGTCTATLGAKPGSASIPHFSGANPNNWDTANIMAAVRTPHPDLVVAATHRGLHAVAGTTQGFRVPENSLASIREAAQKGWEMVELDVRITSDGIPVLTHDRGWGREWCGVANGLFFATTNNPFIAPGTNSKNDASNPQISSTSFSNTRSLFGETEIRDSVGLVARLQPNLTQAGPECPPFIVYDGEYPPTLQEALQTLKQNNVQMVLTLDVQSIAAAQASWNVVLCGVPNGTCPSPGPDNADSSGRPFYQSVIFKMPAGLFPNGPLDFSKTFGSTYVWLNYMPVITAKAIEPPGGDALVDNAQPNGPDDYETGDFDVVTAGFGSEQAIINWLHQFSPVNFNPPVPIVGVEVVLKESGGILQSVLNDAQSKPFGSNLTTANFNPVGDYYPLTTATPNKRQTSSYRKTGTAAMCCQITGSTILMAKGRTTLNSLLTMLITVPTSSS